MKVAHVSFTHVSLAKKVARPHTWGRKYIPPSGTSGRERPGEEDPEKTLEIIQSITVAVRLLLRVQSKNENYKVLGQKG